VYCAACERDICSICAAKFHPICNLFDTYDLSIITQKLIDEKLKEIKAEEDAALVLNANVNANASEENKVDRILYEKTINDKKAELAKRKKDIEEAKLRLTKDIMSGVDRVFEDYERAFGKNSTIIDRFLASVLQQGATREKTRERLSLIRAQVMNKVKDYEYKFVRNHHTAVIDIETSNTAVTQEKMRKIVEGIDRYIACPALDKLREHARKIGDIKITDEQQKEEKSEQTYFQEANNMVYLCTPHSPYIYTYDVEENVSGTIHLIREDTKTQMNMPFNSSTVMHANMLYLIGGSENLGVCGKECYMYSFLKKYLRIMPALITERREHGAIWANGFIYVVGGWGDNGLLRSCEKIEIDINGQEKKGADRKWLQVKHLRYPKTILTLVKFQRKNETVIYTVGGLAKDTSKCHFEKLTCGQDTLREDQVKLDYSEEAKGNFWDYLEVADVDDFLKTNQMVGAFSYIQQGKEYIMILNGAEKPEDSKAYSYDVWEKKLTKHRKCPNITGCGSLHSRKPISVNAEGKDTYLVGFYDILHFDAEKDEWQEPIKTVNWLSYL